MKCLKAFLLTLVVGAMAGCQKEATPPPPPPSKGGVSINVPGVSVQTGGAKGGVEVKTPNVEVNVPPSK
jgi:hypothetical protein